MKFFAVFAAVVAVAVARMDFVNHAGSDWSLQELSEALQNPDINPAAVPYLEEALNEIMNALFAGHDMDSIHLVLPAGLNLYGSPEPVVPSPVIVRPPVVPSPVVIGPIAPGTSPLVQLIINVNKEQQVAPTPVIPELVPSPVQVVDVVPEQPESVVIPAPVLPELVLPEVNPIDVIAVNPVDMWGPEGLIPVVVGAGDVGPM